MTILKSCIIAFGMYSKIPMPGVEWSEKNMRYSICFFPLVGAVLGLLIFGFYSICRLAGFSQAFLGAGVLTLSVLVTGGIHLDGYMDTMDALHSYQPKERKLEILKDSHIGAFAVLMLIPYVLLTYGALTELKDLTAWILYGFSFVWSRTLSGLSVVWFRGARKDGLLYAFSSTAHKRTVRLVLLLVLAVTAAVMAAVQPVLGIGMCAAGGLCFIYYRYKAYKEFGGVTGDLAGWFLACAELCMLLVLVVLQRFL